ncbi:MAG: hypothetical protein KJ950_03490 [Proteobacteria bacterium]|nr:hypothetical protein [Pseudomonadota bacterium]MBU1686382.1 hypothetical protein [Pseudomonadota bacterium]
MREQDVPQDEGIAEGLKEVCYAVNQEGRYVLAASAGWEPKNITNYQAWEQIGEKLADLRREVQAGRLSPLAYHMARNQMDLALLAQYTGFFRWQIKRHLKPKVFKKLKDPLLRQYATLFRLTVEQFLDPATIDHDRIPGQPQPTPEKP